MGTAEGGEAAPAPEPLAVAAQPPPAVEPLVVVCAGAGLGAGGAGDGRTVGLLVVGLGLGCEPGLDGAPAELALGEALARRAARWPFFAARAEGETVGAWFALAAVAWPPPALPGAEGVAGAAVAEVAA